MKMLPQKKNLLLRTDTLIARYLDRNRSGMRKEINYFPLVVPVILSKLTLNLVTLKVIFFVFIFIYKDKDVFAKYLVS